MKIERYKVCAKSIYLTEKIINCTIIKNDIRINLTIYSKINH